MSPRRPHYLLYSQTNMQGNRSRWSFVLQTANAASTSDSIRAEDIEDESPADRLELLSVVRGLEALPQPARVTLVTPSDYVRRGIRFGLDEWRANNWQWERYGEMVPVKNLDLWRRVDRALAYHQLDMKQWRADNAHTIESAASTEDSNSADDSFDYAPASNRASTRGNNFSSRQPNSRRFEPDYLTPAKQSQTRKRAAILYMIRKIRIIRLRFIKRMIELWQSVAWFYNQARTPLLTKTWDERTNLRRVIPE